MRIQTEDAPVSDSRRYYLEQTRQLAARLERLSADSGYAHRASGIRGALLRAMEQLESGAIPADISDLLQAAFALLVKAARQIEAGDT